MKTIQVLFQKIVIVEVMFIILFLAKNIFSVSIPIFDLVIDTSLNYLTPFAIISLILYVILSLFSNKLVETILGVVLVGLVLYYFIKYIL